ncbi:hypothetical protein ACQW02_23905 [Humitalea sp. 24SJ18S-53]|uniref:hypothetical protein n=1 Tax=Humitalea sp. 24SJ18S-53 TaxID=3422307 RepID=UPI003D66D241
MQARLSAFLASVVLLGLASPAQAQRRDEEVGRIGNVAIFRVFEGARFDRCFGLLPGRLGGARIFWAVGREYTLTVNGVNPPGDKPVNIRTPGGPINARGRTDGGQGRTIIPLNGQQVERLIQVRGNLEVTVEGTTFPYPLQGVTMQQVFQRIEDCAMRNNR